MTPNQKKIFRHTVLNYFVRKSPTHNNAAPKLNAWEQKVGGGGGAFKIPPDRIGLNVLKTFTKPIFLEEKNNLN